MMKFWSAAAVAVLLSITCQSKAQKYPIYYYTVRQRPIYRLPVTRPFSEARGICALYATLYRSADQPARFDGQLTKFFAERFQDVATSFETPMLISVIIDKNGKVCFCHASGINSMETKERLEQAVPYMKWHPAVQNAKPVLFEASIILEYRDSAIVASYAEDEAPVRFIENRNNRNNPDSTLVKHVVWKNWNFHNSMIPDNYAKGIVMDKTGAIWFATIYGLVKIDARSSVWEIFSGKNTPELAPDNADRYGFSDIEVDSSNNIWVSSAGFVARFDGRQWTRYDHSNSPLSGVRNMSVDASGIVWFSTPEGLIRLEGNNFARINMNNSGLASDDIRAVYEDANDGLWFATAKGLNHFRNGQWEVFDSINLKLPASGIDFVTGDQDGNIWACGGGGKNNFLMSIDSSLHARIYAICPVYSMKVNPRTKQVWLATQRGLVSFDGKKSIFHEDGGSFAENKVVTGILIDRNGNKWLSTYHGLVYTTAQ